MRSISQVPIPPINVVPGHTIETWLQIEQWVNGIGMRSPQADNLLRWLLRNIRDRPQPLYQDALLLLTWESLVDLNRILSRLDPDKEELWSNLTWSYMRVVRRIDLSRRRELLGRKLLNDTQHDLRHLYRESRKLPLARLSEPDDRDYDPIASVPDRSAGQAIVEFEINRAWAIRYLRQLVTSGLLTLADYQILLGCCLYGRSINDMAIHLGVPNAVAKKRRQRAIKKLHNNAPHLSPSDPDSPLYQVEHISRKEAGHGSKWREPQDSE